ncbi:MAG: cell division FtsZ family protein, partial [Proteobacteria bacterium]|nr:cell division FtsZ family protein [Pseudomonadota bacterium]
QLKTMQGLEATQGYQPRIVAQIHETLGQLYTEHRGTCPYCMINVGLSEEQDVQIYRSNELEALIGHIYLSHPDEIQKLILTTARDQRPSPPQAINEAAPPASSINTSTVQPPAEITKVPVAKVIGVGNGGCAAVCHIGVEQPGVEFYAVDTDVQQLSKCEGVNRVQIDPNTTRPISTEGDIEKGQNVAQEDQETLKRIVEGADLVFVLAAMGGGTGTGVAPIIANLAKQAGALTIGAVTQPFEFEGEQRAVRAETGIKRMRHYTDALATIPNQRLIENRNQTLHRQPTFGFLDDVGRYVLDSILALKADAGEISLEFADIKSALSDAGDMFMGVARTSGENWASIAVQQALTSPLLEKRSIEGSKSILVRFVVGSDVKSDELRSAMDVVSEASKADRVIFGLAYNEDSLNDEIHLTVIGA